MTMSATSRPTDPATEINAFFQSQKKKKKTGHKLKAEQKRIKKTPFPCTNGSHGGTERAQAGKQTIEDQKSNAAVGSG